MSLYKDASLVMIPSAYKDGKLYSIRPTDGDGDFTFSRGSNLAATRVDVNGLIEKGRENLLLQSNQFDTTWSAVKAGVTSGQSGYDGSSDAWKWKCNSESGFHYAVQSHSTTNFICAYSIYAKAGEFDLFRLEQGNNGQGAWFDLSDGTISTTSANTNSKITSVGNGWYRCEISFVTAATTNFLIGFSATETLNYNGDNVSGGFIQDAQLEQGLVATDYIETGASTAQAGILEDMPRLDYSGGASCPALLLEPQRTNLVTHSEYPLDSSWTTQLGTLTANATTSPEGVDNAVKFLETAAGGRHRSFTSHNTNAGTYCVSVFMKDGNRGYGFLHWAMEGGDGRFSIIVDLSDGQVVDTMNFSGAEVIVDYGTEDYGNGWYRAYIVGTKASSNVSYVNFGLASSDNDTNSSGTPSYTGDGTHYAYFYGTQVEAGSYPTSYIPTYGSSVTRSKDDSTTLDLSSAGVDGEDVTYFLEFKNNQDIARDSGATSLRFSSNTSNLGSFRVYRSSSSAKQLTVVFQDNGSDFVPSGYEMTSDNPKVAVKRIWSTGQIKVFVDGTEVVDGTNTDMNAWYKIDMEGSGSTLEIKQLVAFPTALTDSECIALTE